jgi:hypothetical protein
LAASFVSANVAYWRHFAALAEFDRYRGIADIDQAAPIRLDL